MSRQDVDDVVRIAAAEGEEVRRDLRQAAISGLALTVPFLVTLLVLSWAFGMIADALSPVVAVLVTTGVVEGMGPLLVQGLAFTLVVGIVLVVGLAAQHGPDTHLGRRVDVLMEDIPGIGSIYTSVERMSDVLLEGDTGSFQEVKLVEFPAETSYAIAFLTADAPAVVEEAADRDAMVTVFVPMAPNPVMGGHLLTLPEERVHDIDLSVEEGMEAIMTTGITIDASADEGPE